jgi:hypothetical protein
MEFTPAEHLPEPDDAREAAHSLREMAEVFGWPGSDLMFDGLVFEQDPMSEEYYTVLYGGKVLSIEVDGHEPYLDLLADSKFLCIRNGSDGMERSQEEHFERFIDPPEGKDDGEWEELPWTERVVRIPFNRLDTHTAVAVGPLTPGHTPPGPDSRLN